MVWKRLGAVIVAVALVLGALWFRSWRGHGSDAASGPSATTDDSARPLPSVVCATELAAACDALEQAGLATTVTEAAGTTAARLEADVPTDQVPSAWLTLDPWPALVDAARDRAQLAPLFSADPVRLASSPLVTVGGTDRMSILGQQCGGGPTWKCIGDAAGQPWSGIGGQASWQQVKPGFTSPVDSAAGLLVFANAVASYFGRTDVSSADLAKPEFRAWVRRLLTAVPKLDPVTTPYAQWLITPTFDVVGTTTAETKATPPGKPAAVVATTPAGRADAVLAVTPRRTVSERATGAARRALTGAGWDGPAAGGAEGLPSPGIMEALQQLWREVRR